MGTEFLQQLEVLEGQRKALFARVEHLDEERLNRPPAAGKWSIIQVMCHLISAEKAFLASLRKEVSRGTGIGRAGLKNTLKRGLLKVAFSLPLRFKAPPRAEALPEHQDLETTRGQWDEVRAGWWETLGAFPPELADRELFRHPVVGRLSLAQGLDFMVDHLERHGRQIDRIIAQGQ